MRGKDVGGGGKAKLNIQKKNKPKKPLNLKFFIFM
jgi:hypothetical protein